jgi:dipeptidyl aminopeptidase/acylaminoacyl peptidase
VFTPEPRFRHPWQCARAALTQALLLPLAAFTSLFVAPPARAELPPLIPREALFPKPAAMQSLRLSPDGRALSYLGADAAGVQQLWVRDLDRGTTRRLTDVPSPGVRSYEWAQTSRIICYERRDDAGPRLVAIDLATGRERTVVAIDGAEFGNLVTRPGVPDDLLLSLRVPGASEDDVYRLNLATGALALDTKNPGGVPANGFHADHTLKVRAAQRMREDGGTELLVRDEPSAAWRAWLAADTSYSLAVEGFSDDGQALLLRTDLGADTAGLVWRRIRDGEERVIARSTDLDVENVLRHPRTGSVQAVSYLSDPRRWEALDRSFAVEFQRLGELEPGSQLGIASRDVADERWLVWLSRDSGSPRCHLWNRATRKATLVFEERPHLRAFRFARVRPISFTARDGLRVHGYLTVPIGVPARRLPLVVWVHGGPSLRDSWGFDHIGQLFVNRGYAFLRVNFRGSRGYGRRFRLAGRKQWGRAMQDDIVDAVEFVVRSGVADRSRMAIIGHSYGGYSALAALALTPDLFACGAASSTAADLVAFAEAFPRTPGNAWVRDSVGDLQDPVDVAALRSVSPLTFVDRVTKPVLIARGDRDGIPPAGIDAFVARLDARGGQVTSIVYEGDGHFFRRENELDYFARVEALFARHLGGRSEPMKGDGQAGSTVRVLTMPR